MAEALQQLNSGGVAVAGMPQPDLPAADRAPATTGWFDQTLESLSRQGKPTNEKDLGRLRQTLAQAGFRGVRAQAVYLTLKLVTGLALGGGFLAFNALRPQPLSHAALGIVAMMTLGFYLPNVWLMQRITKRKFQINSSLPDALDLIVTCVEAGLGLDGAMERVSREIRLSSPLLSKELAQVSLEMGAGRTRGEAFRRLARRTGVEELHNLAAILTQTELFITSVSRSLRVQADAMRIRRTQQAEERAATVAVKLTIPLVC